MVEKQTISYEEVLETGLRERARATLATGDASRVTELVGEAVALAEGLLSSLRTTDPPDAPAACREGCAFCCHYQAAVTPPEALAIAQHLRETRGTDEVATLAARCRTLATQEQGFDAAARIRANRPCVLLDSDARCSIYAARPFACRGANATDATQCEAALNGDDVAVTLYAHQARIMKAAARGLNTAQEPRDGELELTAALAIALSDETAADRWLAGEAVFADARLPVRRKPGEMA